MLNFIRRQLPVILVVAILVSIFVLAQTRIGLPSEKADTVIAAALYYPQANNMANTPTGTPTRTPTPPCGLAWNPVTSPNPNTQNVNLLGLEVVSPNNVWATGTAIQHWDGISWSIVPSPYGAWSLSAVSANDIWAVSNTGRGAGFATLTMHWDGSLWSVIPSPSPNAFYNYLFDVSAVSANDVWAVGFYGYTSQTLILHWDGTQWTQVPSPNVGTDTNNVLWTVKAISATDVWAAGWYGPVDDERPLLLHWDGIQWSRFDISNPTGLGGRLMGLDGIAANDVWAVGYYVQGGGGGALTLHWDGSQWSHVPNPGSGRLYGISELAAGDVWAAGSNAEVHTLIEHWNGVSWTLVSSPNPDPRDNVLYDIAAISSTNAWAVGYQGSNLSGERSYALIERYADPCAPAPRATDTPLPSNTPGATRTPTGTPTATATPTPRCPGERFSDVCPSDYFYTPVLYLNDRSVVSGYSDGTFRPNNNTTRAQLAKIVVLAEGLPIDTTGSPHFSDVDASNPFYAFIETAYNHGLISGYTDGTFRWGANVTRGQLSKIVVLAEGWEINTHGAPHFLDIPISDPFYGFIETAFGRGVISGYSDQTFRAGNSATRGQIAKIVYNAVTGP